MGSELCITDSQSTNEIFYYPTFDEYSETSLSTTAHYLVAIPEQTITSTTGFYFYINDNITKHTPNSNDITIGTGYKGYASIASVSSSVYANSCKQIFVKLNVKGTPSGNTEFFKYKFVDSEALAQAIDYESDLNTGTSRVKIKPDTVLYPNVGDKFAMKCIYSLGDVNRDGQVTLDDSKAVMSYNVHTAEADPARGDDGYYDTIAFKLAADFNEDGEIDIRDVVAINQYVTSH